MAPAFSAVTLGGKFALQCVFIAASFGIAFPATAALTLQLRVTTHTEGGASAPGAPVDKIEEQQVFVGDHYFSVKTGASLSIVDFVTRRRYAVDLATGRYVDYSLFDTVGFRVMEMQNRLGLSRVLTAIDLASPLSDVVYNEQSLSVLAGPGKQLETTVHGGEQVLAIDGKTLMRRSTTGTRIGTSDAARFVQFLRYTAGGHPLVLATLAGAGDIPAQFTFSYREAGSIQTRQYEILAVTMSAPARYDLTPYVRGSSAPDAVDQLLEKIATLQSPTHAVMHDAMQQQAAHAFAEQRPLDAMLGATELALMTGAPVQPFSAGQTAQLRADPMVQQVSAAIGAHGKEALTAAIPILQQARWQKTDKGYMLTLFEANDRQSLGQLDAAKPMFVSVLAANPWLAGAWKDLGDLQFRQFDMAHAWRCWDAGRNMAPTLAIFASVDQLEKNLVQQHPEYF